ncbi:hypothetical protein [Clostridium sp. BL-8]|uniref:hypothetical protein n=1 Tax=Clostridium sp. BL-8 TaxID=349938 RepID=UPI00098C91EF|nr:hypothetical protein [Clostridium sp. BL-8]OOM74227.1 hypothetical protein CLOBL_44030 [Clostridium sp. BL-8]
MGYKKRQPSSQINRAKKSSDRPYNIHMKFMYAGIICLIIGFKFHQFFLMTGLLEFCGLILMFRNWKRINAEYEQGKQAKKK